MNMGWKRFGDARSRAVTRQETKVCPLCGGLNYLANAECRTCGWHGAFEQDAAAVDYHWQRLTERHEEVRLEHLTPCAVRVVGELGVVRRASVWRRFAAACRSQWEAFLSRRDARCAKREAALRPRSALRPQ